MTKLNAFTLMEMMVVMVISAVAVTICFACFSLIQIQFIDFSNTQKAASDQMLVDRLLAKDFSDSKRIVKTENGLSCDYESYTVAYQFLDSLIIREETPRSDTFRIALNQIKMKQITRDSLEAGEIVDELVLKLSANEAELIWSFQKHYDADGWIKMDHNRN